MIKKTLLLASSLVVLGFAASANALFYAGLVLNLHDQNTLSGTSYPESLPTPKSFVHPKGALGLQAGIDLDQFISIPLRFGLTYEFPRSESEQGLFETDGDIRIKGKRKSEITFNALYPIDVVVGRVAIGGYAGSETYALAINLVSTDASKKNYRFNVAGLQVAYLFTLPLIQLEAGLKYELYGSKTKLHSNDFFPGTDSVLTLKIDKETKIYGAVNFSM